MLSPPALSTETGRPLAGFHYSRVDVDGIGINVATAGSGPPVLLLHGYPQTHAMWHPVAGVLAESYTVVAPDLRGYGDSDKPAGDADHEVYAKRAMARDQVGLMRSLGFERFMVVGHDRGARVGHRMALDYPRAVERLALLDIIPTSHLFATVNDQSARSYYHWFFLSQPPDLPERLIGSDPVFYLRWTVRSWTAGDTELAAAAMAEYERCFASPEAVHASCEDYRAGASSDLRHDAQDGGARVGCPVLALWGAAGRIGRLYDVLETWRERADDVRGHTVPGGHFVVEESPEEVLAGLRPFLAGGVRAAPDEGDR